MDRIWPHCVLNVTRVDEWEPGEERQSPERQLRHRVSLDASIDSEVELGREQSLVSGLGFADQLLVG